MMTSTTNNADVLVNTAYGNTKEAEKMNYEYGLLGERLDYSYSAFLHRAMGCKDYMLVQIKAKDLKNFIKKEELKGFNVTIPYKKEVVSYCDYLSDEAKEIGSVNTLVKRYGKLYGYNTDAFGFSNMAKDARISFEGKKVVIFGSGGASAACEYVAKKEGAKEVVIISRTGENNYDNLELHEDGEILVNATPVGTYPNVNEKIVDVKRFKNCCGVLDLVYNPRKTALIKDAEKLKIPCSDGLPMLVYQAVRSEELFRDTSFFADYWNNKDCKDPEVVRNQSFSDMGFVDNMKELHTTTALLRYLENPVSIFLVGYMASGKTTVGKKLAQILNMEFVDMDDEVEKRSGRKIKDIFEQDGEETFRKLESKTLLKVGYDKKKVFATGGGIVLNKKNLEFLKYQDNVVVFLNVSPETVLKRTQGDESRPLLKDEARNPDILRKHMMERARIYDYCATVTVDVDGKNPEEIAMEILENIF